MPKKTTTETVILIRLPEVETKTGTGTLTIQRGELGHLHAFTYSGLTLRGKLAEAVQAALLSLAELEASPPPDSPPPADSTEADLTTETLLVEEEEPEEDESQANEAVDGPPPIARTAKVPRQTGLTISPPQPQMPLF